MADKTLTAKQEAFIREYLVDLNATQAAIRAGYSEHTAGQQGERLLKKVEIARLVSEAKAKRAAETGITAEWVLREAADTYAACREKEKLSDAVSALKLLGSHVDVQAFRERIAQEHTISPEAAKWLGQT